MSTFDPYHKWLAIPPAEQPPHHYRLLGVALFEADPDVIEAAADRQMTYIRQCATGQYVKESQQVLNELSAARICLLTAAKKQAYDAELKSRLAPAPAPAAAPPASPAMAPKDVAAAKSPPASGAPTKSDTVNPAEVAHQERRTRKLLDEQDFDAAIPILVRLAELPGTLYKSTADWARAELPIATQKQQKLRERSRAACEKARELMKTWNYAEAAQAIEAIPAPARSEDARRILEQATQNYEDSIGLQQEIDDAVKERRYERLLPLVKRFLKLKPNSLRMQNLARNLARNSPERAARHYRGAGKYFDVAGRLVEVKELAVGVFLIVGLCLGVTYGVRQYGERLKNLAGSPGGSGNSAPASNEAANSSAGNSTQTGPGEQSAPDAAGKRPPSQSASAITAESAPKMKIELVKAEYGSGERWLDVTDKVRESMTDGPVILLPKPGYFDSIGIDPAFGVTKEMKIKYRCNGVDGEARFAEASPIILPVPPPVPVTLEITKAEYGDTGQRRNDVTEVLQKLVGPSLVIPVPGAFFNASFGDPAPFGQKFLTVAYRVNGQPCEASFDENTVIELHLPDPGRKGGAASDSGESGHWAGRDNWVVAPPQMNARHVLPDHPPDEFTITLSVRRLTGNSSLTIGLPLPGKQKHALVTLDAQPGGFGGLETIGRKRVADNETMRRGRLFWTNIDRTIRCTVRKEGITCLCDGEKIIDWRGDLDQLSVPPGFDVPDKRALFFSTSGSRLAVRVVEVTAPDALSPTAWEAETEALAGAWTIPGGKNGEGHNEQWEISQASGEWAVRRAFVDRTGKEVAYCVAENCKFIGGGLRYIERFKLNPRRPGGGDTYAGGAAVSLQLDIRNRDQVAMSWTLAGGAGGQTLVRAGSAGAATPAVSRPAASEDKFIGSWRRVDSNDGLTERWEIRKTKGEWLVKRTFVNKMGKIVGNSVSESCVFADSALQYTERVKQKPAPGYADVCDRTLQFEAGGTGRIEAIWNVGGRSGKEVLGRGTNK
jgi:hypothetical protein